MELVSIVVVRIQWHLLTVVFVVNRLSHELHRGALIPEAAVLHHQLVCVFQTHLAKPRIYEDVQDFALLCNLSYSFNAVFAFEFLTLPLYFVVHKA